MAWLARRTWSPALLLIAALAAFGVLLGCGVLAGEALKQAEAPNGSTPFDSSITSWMVAHRDHVLTAVARVLSAIGSQKVLAPLAGIAAVLLLGRRRIVAALFLAVAWGGAIGLYSLTKHFVLRPRPPADIRLMRVGASSFPSGHATQSLATFIALAAVATVALAHVRAAAGIALAIGLGVAVGWSRVYLGVHWSTDVIAGWLIGAAWVSCGLWLSWRAPRAPPSGGR
ncbi:MAG: phosphatase PAP2 family protein [Solirubrobacteraceae bacterium]